MGQASFGEPVFSWAASFTRSNTTAKDNYEVKATGAYTNEAIQIVGVSVSGATQFFFNMGGGNDVVISSSANDSVNLFDVKLSDIKTADITNTGVSLELHDGSKLTVQTTRDLKFLLASGETFTANHTAKRWDV